MTTTALIPYAEPLKTEIPKTCPVCGLSKCLARWIRFGMFGRILKCSKCGYLFKVE